MIVYVFFHLYTSYFSTSPWAAGDMLSPFLILDSKMGSIVCISLVHDCIRLFSFVHFLLFFYLFLIGLGTYYPLLFWFWIPKWAHSFVFRYYMIAYIFFYLYFPPFSRINRLFFVCAPIFLICATPLLKLEAENPRILSEISEWSDWGENGFCASFVLAGCDFFWLCSIRSKVIWKILHFKVTHSII